MTIDNTSQCEDCTFCTLDESNPAKIICYCRIDDRYRIYGAHIECDRKEINKGYSNDE